MKELTKKQAEFCDYVLQETNVNLYAHYKNGEDFDTFLSAVEEDNETCEDIIYYTNAMDYLAKNDPSLIDSIGLAMDMGCTLNNINSELLASLLKSNNNNKRLLELKDEIKEFFKEVSI